MSQDEKNRQLRKERIQRAITEVASIVIQLKNQGAPRNVDTWKVAVEIQRNVILEEQASKHAE
jgi:hypothetical protein